MYLRYMACHFLSIFIIVTLQPMQGIDSDSKKCFKRKKKVTYIGPLNYQTN